jgi:hypothetical protein
VGQSPTGADGYPSNAGIIHPHSVSSPENHRSPICAFVSQGALVVAHVKKNIGLTMFENFKGSWFEADGFVSRWGISYLISMWNMIKPLN